jgi:lipopolysaccharide biosynthesis regulator YciM
VHDRLVAVAPPEQPTALAHYHCELAERARARGRPDEAREHLRRARAVQRNFARSALIRADVALDMGEPELAATLCQRVVELHPRLLPLALPRVMRAVRESGTADLQRRVAAWIRPEPAARAELAYAAIVAGLDQEIFVQDCLPDLLREDPALGDIVRALSGDPAHLTAEQRRDIAASLGRILRRSQRYRCVDCGFASASHFWQCPGCRNWDAFAPMAQVDLTPRGGRSDR